MNGHSGNQRLRTLALERKTAFDAGNYTEKRSLAAEIVQIIKALDPPGRFLKRAAKKTAPDADADEEAKDEEPVKKEGVDGWTAPDKAEISDWEELGDEKSIHKACQVMRDIDRPDRKDREERRAKKKQKVLEGKSGKVSVATDSKDVEKKEDTGDEKAAVEEAVAATEEALDKALDAAGNQTKEEVAQAEAMEV